jgi:hypothetical protein
MTSCVRCTLTNASLTLRHTCPSTRGFAAGMSCQRCPVGTGTSLQRRSRTRARRGCWSSGGSRWRLVRAACTSRGQRPPGLPLPGGARHNQHDYTICTAKELAAQHSAERSPAGSSTMRWWSRAPGLVTWTQAHRSTLEHRGPCRRR